MSLVPKIYMSTDSGAPALTGQAGSLTTLLDAILVDGYGSGANAKDPMGWTREFTATNKRAYRGDPVEGSGYRLRIDDSAAIGNARHAFVQGYETLSDIDTGINPVPTLAQLANGAIWVKSSVLNATSRPWFAIGNCRAFYLFTMANGEGYCAHFAGDLISNKAVDQHNFALTAGNITTWSGTGTTNFMFRSTSIGSNNGANQNGFVARGNGMGVGAVRFECVLEDFHGTRPGRQGFPFPDPISGGLVLSRLQVKEAAYRVRGRYPGVWAPVHNTPFSDLEVISDIGLPEITDAIAKTYRDDNLDNANNYGQVLFSTTLEGWDS